MSGKKCQQSSDVSCMMLDMELTDCLTKNTTESPVKGKPCIFPWVYNGKDYNACANPNYDPKGAWCPTDRNDVYLSSPTSFGYCNDDCPKETVNIGKLDIYHIEIIIMVNPKIEN